MHDYCGIGLTHLRDVCFYCSFLLLLLVLLLVLLSCYYLWHIFPGITSNNPKCSWLFPIYVWIILKLMRTISYLSCLSKAHKSESCHSWWEILLHIKKWEKMLAPTLSCKKWSIQTKNELAKTWTIWTIK